MNKINVKFNALRWVVFFSALFTGWLIALLFSWDSLFRVINGTIFAMATYFYFYFKDKKRI